MGLPDLIVLILLFWSFSILSLLQYRLVLIMLSCNLKYAALFVHLPQAGY